MTRDEKEKNSTCRATIRDRAVVEAEKRVVSGDPREIRRSQLLWRQRKGEEGGSRFEGRRKVKKAKQQSERRQ